jgi:hypothetical protein
MYPLRQRIIVAVLMAIAIAGQINSWFFKKEIFGLDEEFISRILFAPLFFGVIWVVWNGRRSER